MRTSAEVKQWVDSCEIVSSIEFNYIMRFLGAQLSASIITENQAKEYADNARARFIATQKMKKEDNIDPGVAAQQDEELFLKEHDFILLHKRATATRALIAVKGQEKDIVVKESKAVLSDFWQAVFCLMADTRCRIETVLSLKEKDITTEMVDDWSKNFVTLSMNKETEISNRHRERYAIDLVRQSRKREAKITDNLREYVRVSEMRDNELYDIMADREKNFIKKYAQKSNTYVKKFEIDFSTYLLLKDLMEKENPTTEGYVFAAARTGSHRAAKSTSKVSRQAAWKMLNRCPQTKEILGGLLKQ